jgi:hypothetical protein
MKLKFLGTRGEVDIRTRLHWMHSSLEVSCRGHSVMIDCGEDWPRRVYQIGPRLLSQRMVIQITRGFEERSALQGLCSGADLAMH